MRRTLFLVLLNIAAVAALSYFVGGAKGPGANAPDPHVDESASLPAADDRIVPPGRWPLAIRQGQGVWLPTDPEPLEIRDEATGESVLVPDFERYTFQAREIRPIRAGDASHQAAEALGVKVQVFREPRTLEEARALVEGLPEAKEHLLKWVVEAPAAEAEFLQEGLSVTERRKQASTAETLIVLSGGVRLRDFEEGITLEGDEIELEPGLGIARMSGVVVIRHPAFEMTGEDLEITREKDVEQILVKKNANVRILHELKDKHGKPLMDLGGEEFRPGFIRAAGGAHIVREKAFGREQLRLILKDKVHAEQEGGRSLDAERLTVVAWRVVGKTARDDWHLSRFEAAGGAVLQYPGVSTRGTPLLALLRAERILHEVADDGTSTTLLEGRPRIDLHGDVPLQGFGGQTGIGLLSASAEKEAWVRLPRPGEVPPGEDPARYLRLVLKGGARLERRDASINRDWDRIDGDELTMLLKRVEVPRPARSLDGTSRPPKERFVACSFALRGDVEISGTRMSGTTSRLVGEHLDTTSPSLVAEGPSTDFRFHGIRPGERMLGGNRPVAGQPRRQAQATTTGAPVEEWVLERLRAVGQLDIRTSLGGPTVGLPALIEGAELAYDRVSDRATLQGSLSAPARVAVGDPDHPRHTVTARSMSFDRRRGIVRAQGTVQGHIYVATDGSGKSGGVSALGLGDAKIGTAAVFRVATSGRIEIRGLLTDARRGPRLDADQVIRIEGDVLAQVISDEKTVDQLRAQRVEVALRRVTQEAPDTMSAPMASARSGRRATTAVSPKTDKPKGPVKYVRWDLEAEVLAARVGDDGLESIEALEGAVLRSADGEIRGRQITYDANRRVAEVRGSAELEAQAIFGTKEARNEVWSPSMRLSLGAHGAEALQADGPAWAVLIRTTKSANGTRWERFEARCAAAITVTQTELRSDGLVEILRNLRTEAGGRWESPATLKAYRLVVEGDGLLAGSGADVRRVIASGPNTHFRMGEGSSLIRLWGRKFDLDVTTSLGTLTGLPNEKVRVVIGPQDAPKADSELRRLVIDLKSGMMRNMELDQLILRGGREGGGNSARGGRTR